MAAETPPRSDAFASRLGAGAMLPFLPTLIVAAIVGIAQVAPDAGPSPAPVASDVAVPRFAADSDAVSAALPPGLPARLAFAAYTPLIAAEAPAAHAWMVRVPFPPARHLTAIAAPRPGHPPVATVLVAPVVAMAGPTARSGAPAAALPDAASPDAALPDWSLPFAPVARTVGNAAAFVAAQADAIEARAESLGADMSHLVVGLR